MTEPTTVPPGEQPTTQHTDAVSVGAMMENPMEGGDQGAMGVRGGANMYGGFSIQKFCQVGGLSRTHEDAGGWLTYVNKFTPINFWFQDANVKVWAYNPTYDNWQDTYGMDAVTAVYHSGHGGMDGNGVFYAPLGADWATQHDCTAVSSNMRLGDQHVRYIFWSTCLSCRVLGGQNPTRTWNVADLGWRMLFGFETVSWDDGNYGKWFWEEWNKNKSFSTAWMDASWRIAHDQAPAVVACGATQAEAQDRVFNERYFSRAAVSRNWWWWRWYNVAAAARQPMLALPQQLLLARLQPAAATAPSRAILADRYELDLDGIGGASLPPQGFRAASGNKSISYTTDGMLDVQLAKPNLGNRKQLGSQQALSTADQAMQRYGLDQQAPVVLDRVLYSQEGGASAAGSGQVEGPYTTATIVQYRQLINGVPVITPGAGTIRVTVDNDGNVTHVHSSVRPVYQLSDRGLAPSQQPTPTGGVAGGEPPAPESGGADNYEQKLAAKFSQQLGSWALSGQMPVGFATVPDSTEIGYDIRGDDAVLIARKAVEVDFGNGYRKRYWITTPLFE